MNTWLTALIVCILLLVSAFFSGSETGLMALNRYRLRHQVRKGVMAAKRVSTLIERPEQLLSVILIGNTLAVVIASSLFTLLAEKLFGHTGILVAPLLLTILMLIFAEITPKTLAAIHPERIAYAVSLPLKACYWIFYPLVRLLGFITLGILNLFGINTKLGSHDAPLSHDELRVLIASHPQHGTSPRTMLQGVLDLEHLCVDDIMIPRNDVMGIDLSQPWKTILKTLHLQTHHRMLVYRNSIDQPYGMLDTRNLSKLLMDNALNRNALLKSLDPMHFIPEGTPLNTQLRRFQTQRYRNGLVVDEHGMVIGFLSLQDILEEIVGDFNDEGALPMSDLQMQEDGSVMVPGAIAIRDLNRELGLNLPTQGPNTLGGLIMEALETLPQSGVGLRVGGCPVEIVRVENNSITLAKLMPQHHQAHADEVLPDEDVR